MEKVDIKGSLYARNKNIQPLQFQKLSFFLYRVTEDTQKNLSCICRMDCVCSHRPASQEAISRETDELMKQPKKQNF